MAAMAVVRVKRKIIASERYPEGVFSSKLCRKKTRVKTTDRKLYPVVVTDVDKVGKRVKIHYVGYSERYDEWRACESEDNNLFQRMELLSSPSSSSLDDRMELIHGELYREIKRKLYSGRKDDPSTRVEVRIDQDVFNGGLALAGKAKTERGKVVHSIDSNQTLNHLLGLKWDERIFNENGDFAFVIEGTVRFWLARRNPIQEFKVIGGKYIKSEIEDNFYLVFTFVRGDGNRHNYATRN